MELTEISDRFQIFVRKSSVFAFKVYIICIRVRTD